VNLTRQQAEVLHLIYDGGGAVPYTVMNGFRLREWKSLRDKNLVEYYWPDRSKGASRPVTRLTTAGLEAVTNFRANMGWGEGYPAAPAEVRRLKGVFAALGIKINQQEPNRLMAIAKKYGETALSTGSPETVLKAPISIVCKANGDRATTLARGLTIFLLGEKCQSIIRKQR